ncbi:hypothetical protein N806_06140 [Rhodococcus sp. P27]|nr:hypothetical protein N806_06140 [Rhodococcus sp. P27]
MSQGQVDVSQGSVRGRLGVVISRWRIVFSNRVRIVVTKRIDGVDTFEDGQLFFNLGQEALGFSFELLLPIGHTEPLLFRSEFPLYLNSDYVAGDEFRRPLESVLMTEYS